MIANANWGAFPKLVRTVDAATGQPSQYSVPARRANAADLSLPAAQHSTPTPLS